MGNYKIKKGFDIQLSNKPTIELMDLERPSIIGVAPLEYKGIRWRLLVSENDVVKCGTPLLENKLNEAQKICAPSAGTIKKIVRGERRFIESIIIAPDHCGEVIEFTKTDLNSINSLDREFIIEQLLKSGYIAYLIQRPFSKIADISLKPKSIFVNGMNTGPFQADATVVVNDATEAFIAGLELMKKLTYGKVHLCISDNAKGAIRDVSNVDVHTFSGVHPAGNTSVHISRVEPMSPTDIIWTIKAVDLVQIGKLFLKGTLPETKIVSLGGNCVKYGEAKHYRVRVGSPISIFADKIVGNNARYISGDILSGKKLEKNDFIGFYQSSLTVIEESDKRHFMGWAMPGFTRYSYSRTFMLSLLNFVLGRKRVKNILGESITRLNTNMNGSKRAMVLTGYYDKVMPLNIMVDFLIRAILAEDTEEAIQLGILETAPEDFALCEFICPSKINIQEIIQHGLDMVEEEGI